MKLKVGATVEVSISRQKTWMKHFTNNFVGLLGRNAFQKYGGTEGSWTVYHPKKGAISWYDSEDLRVITESTLESELEARRLEDHN